MFRRSVFTLAAAALCALATTGCPSTNTVDVGDPGRIDGPDEHTWARERLAKNRARHLDELHAYWKAGVFPRNEQLPMIGNVFKDSSGHLCAAANLIKLDGYGDLVDRTATENNFVRLADVKEGALHEWILQSGFTQEEVAMIQVPYMPVQQISLEQERARLQQHLAAVEERLRDDTEQSLAIALRELVQREPGRIAYAPAPMVDVEAPPFQFATPPEPRL
jgi:hypothetical protein